MAHIEAFRCTILGKHVDGCNGLVQESSNVAPRPVTRYREITRSLLTFDPTNRSEGDVKQVIRLLRIVEPAKSDRRPHAVAVQPAKRRTSVRPLGAPFDRARDRRQHEKRALRLRASDPVERPRNLTRLRRNVRLRLKIKR